MDDVENDGFTRQEILDMVKYLKDMDHKMAVACEMLGGSIFQTDSVPEVSSAQMVAYQASCALDALCKRHGVEL